MSSTPQHEPIPTPDRGAPGAEPAPGEAGLVPDPRRRGVVARIVPRLAPFVPVVLAAWLALSSASVGGPGTRWAVWLGALGLPLAILLWIGAALMRADSRRSQPRATRPVTAWIAIAAWCLILVLGLLLPDRVDGHAASVFLAIFPEATPGLTAGFANTVGVLSFAASAAAIVAASLDLRRTRRLARGEVLEADPEEEDRLREQWLESFRAGERS